MSGNLCSGTTDETWAWTKMRREAVSAPVTLWGLPGAPALGYGSSPGPLMASLGQSLTHSKGEHQTEGVDQLPTPYPILTPAPSCPYGGS